MTRTDQLAKMSKLMVATALMLRNPKLFPSLEGVGTLTVGKRRGTRSASLSLHCPGDNWDRVEGIACALERGPLVVSRRKLSWLGALFVLMAMGCLVRGRPRWSLLRHVSQFREAWNNAKMGAITPTEEETRNA